jgi:uncharacterized YccA/Bax inhibitor family protein
MNLETTNPLLKRADSFTGTATSTMDLHGTVNKTGILLLICIGSAAFAWVTPAVQGLIFVPLILALVFCLVAVFKPQTSPFTAPAYAVCEGLVLGAVSQMINFHMPGIVANAILLTFSILALFLVLYATRIVRVTNGMRIAIIAATLGIFVVYAIDMLLRLFGVSIPFIHDNGPVGIGISLFICAIAAFNFFLDFDAIERFIQAGSPKYMEWYCGLSLLITLVWLYLEILRLLSKFQSRR